MRTINTFELGMMTPSATTATEAAALPDGGGDALAAACICGIVGGLIVGLAIVPAIPLIAVGSLFGAGVGVVVAYH